MNDLVIRRSTPPDLIGIKSIFEQEHAYSNTLQLPYPSDAHWEKHLSDTSDNVTSLVAELDGEIAGQLSLIVHKQLRRKHVATFGMGVFKQYMGKGVGSRLLAAALDLADNWLIIRRVEMEVYSDNEPAIKLYKKFGFLVEGECRQFAFRNGRFVDALIMARLIEPGVRANS